MVFRLATTNDLDQLVDLWMELMRHHQPWHPLLELSVGAGRIARHELRTRLLEPYTRIFVCDGGRRRLLGMIVTRYYGSSPTNRLWRCGYIAETVVRESHRGQGIGRRLARVAGQWLRSLGLDYLELQVVPRNEAAVRFWEAQGFTPFTQQMVRLLKDEAPMKKRILT